MASTDPAKLFSVEGMVIVITGGATGIGLMMTTAFANAGAAKVYILGRRKEKLDEAVASTSKDGKVVGIVADVTSKDSLCAAANQIRQEVGYINLLCCNSGVMPTPIPANPKEASVEAYAQAALDLGSEPWDSAFSTNTKSIPLTAFAFLTLLDAGNRKANTIQKSQVLVTSSIAGYLRNPGSNMAYGASKAAATHLVKHLSGTLVPYSIRVNGIAPGLFPSELAAGLIAGAGVSEEESVKEGAFDKSFIPAQRLGSGEDVGGTVLYLASRAASYVNGNVLVMDGGRISQLPGVY
ncbi:hypothetical protein MBLNU230_g3668t1 [Neophaeotheca triangularis]